MPQNDVSNCSSSQIEESETVSPYCSNDEQKYDFEKDAVDEKDDDDYVPEPISDVNDEGFEKDKGSPHRNLIKNAEFDLKKNENVYLCDNDGTTLFRGSFAEMDFSTMVHNHEILEHHGRFLITHCYQDALEKWDDYDLDVHRAGTYVLWDNRKLKPITHHSTGIENDMHDKSKDTEVKGSPAKIIFEDGDDVYLYEVEGKYLFRAAYSEAGSSSDQETPRHQANILIKYCYEGEVIKWDDYDPNLHFANGYIMWDTRKSKAVL